MNFGVRCVSTALDFLVQPLDSCLARIRRHPKKVAPRQIQSSADTEHSKGEWLATIAADQTLTDLRRSGPTRPPIHPRMEAARRLSNEFRVSLAEKLPK